MASWLQGNLARSQNAGENFKRAADTKQEAWNNLTRNIGIASDSMGKAMAPGNQARANQWELDKNADRQAQLMGYPTAEEQRKAQEKLKLDQKAKEKAAGDVSFGGKFSDRWGDWGQA